MAKDDFFVAAFKEIQDKLNKKIETAFSDYKKPYSHITHNHKRILLEMRLPNVKKEDLSVNININSVEVLVKKENKVKNKRNIIEMYRKIYLPKGLDIKNADTKFDKGELKIEIPRKNKRNQ